MRIAKANEALLENIRCAALAVTSRPAAVLITRIQSLLVKWHYNVTTTLLNIMVAIT